MSVSENTQKILADLKELGVTEEQYKVLEEVVKNEKVDKLMGESLLRQTDYSKSQDDLKARMAAHDKEFAGKMETVKTYEGDLNVWKADQEKEIQANATSKAEAEKQLSALHSHVQAKAVEMGLDPKDFQLEGANVNQNGNQNQNQNQDLPPVFDPDSLKKDYLPRAEFDEVLSGNLRIPAILHDISTEHQKLTGETINAEELLNGAVAAKKPLREFWEESNGIVQKRAEATVAAQTAHDEQIKADAIKETETRLASESFTPKPRDGSLGGSPVLVDGMKLETPKPDETAPPSAIQQKQSRVTDAVKVYTESIAQTQGQ